MEEKKEIVTKETAQKVLSLTEEAERLVITNQKECDKAVEFGRTARALKRVIDDNYDPLVKQAFQMHKSLKASHNKHLEPVLNVMDKTRGLINDYQLEQKRILKEEEEKARKEAEELAEMERNIKEEEALKLADEGKEEEFEDKLVEVEEVRVENHMPVPALIPKLQGSSHRSNWQHEVVDLKALVTAVAKGAIPITFIQADDKQLRAYAKATKGQMRVPGIRFTDKGTVVFR